MIRKIVPFSKRDKIKKIYYILFILIFALPSLYAQRIGDMAPPIAPIKFPSTKLGLDILFSDSGFGIGGFYRKSFNRLVTGFIDLSISESKDDREIEYYDYTGQKFTVGKVNRVFIAPVNAGIQYRLFADNLTDNLRPYVTAGLGPTFVLTTPYDMEFFESFGKAKFKVAAGGYIGFGANFGLSKKNLMGLNVRYYLIHMFDEGVENLEGRFRDSFGHIYITLNIGIMY